MKYLFNWSKMKGFGWGTGCGENQLKARVRGLIPVRVLDGLTAKGQGGLHDPYNLHGQSVEKMQNSFKKVHTLEKILTNTF